MCSRSARALMPNLHGQAEDVDKFVTGMADKMGPENTVAAAIYNDLRPGDCLGAGPIVVGSDAAVVVIDLASGEREALDIGDTTRAIDDPASTVFSVPSCIKMTRNRSPVASIRSILTPVLICSPMRSLCV